ncbi:hypothetical protein [Phenylobacterium sp.]|uniref:hypothetical protein n=1 Tax=Phenylobacterium sp. TaxID=1871053 RepID=UPI00394794F6
MAPARIWLRTYFVADRADRARLGARLELLTPAPPARPNDMRWLSDKELVRYAMVTAEAAG